GSTSSTNIATAGAFDATLNSALDAFVTKLNATGTGVIYSTYLGGNTNTSFGTGIAVDANGNAYVVGSTEASDFPTVTPFKGDQAGSDSFLAKLNPTGSALSYSTYIGGSGTTSDFANAVAVDSAGNAYVVGDTRSSDFLTGPAPVTASFDGSLGGTQDAFLVKVNTRDAGGASSFVYGTFLGGGAVEVGRDVAVDAQGNMYVTGRTSSGDFPTSNALDAGLSGATDGFVTKLNAEDNALDFSTYHGGSSTDICQQIVVDAAGNPYVSCDTLSNDFPTAGTPAQPATGGSDDIAVSKFTGTGNALVYSTYLGGSGGDTQSNIAVDSHGNVVVAGTTFSTDFPVVNAFQSTPPNAAGGDLFVTKLSSDGSQFTYSTYLGGAADFDEAKGVALDPAGNAYVVGTTSSTDYPTTSGASQTALEGSSDAFVTKLSQFGACGTQPSFTASTGSPFVAGTNPSFVTFGDFNEDGNQDLAVANLTSSNVSILLGDGTGSFGGANNFTTGTSPRSVAVGDFNEDGNQDLAVANNVSNNVSVLLGNGAGSFSAAITIAAGTTPLSVALGDFNNDSRPDLTTANSGSNNVSVLLNNCTAPLTGYVVNVTTDVSDSNPGNDACDDGAGNCSLRAAIQEANATAGTDTITFNIPVAGVQTISPASALPPSPALSRLTATRSPAQP
nr:SBBP repeat-containing protein [Acidobacteriota bacterium]